MSIYSKSYVTTPQHSAMNWGSGSLNVLATPSMIAFIENAAFLYCEEDLDVSKTTVGAQITVQHLAATKIGQTVEVKILAVEKDGYCMKLENEETIHGDEVIRTFEKMLKIKDEENGI